MPSRTTDTSPSPADPPELLLLFLNSRSSDIIVRIQSSEAPLTSTWGNPSHPTGEICCCYVGHVSAACFSQHAHCYVTLHDPARLNSLFSLPWVPSTKQLITGSFACRVTRRKDSQRTSATGGGNNVPMPERERQRSIFSLANIQPICTLSSAALACAHRTDIEGLNQLQLHARYPYQPRNSHPPASRPRGLDICLRTDRGPRNLEPSMLDRSRNYRALGPGKGSPVLH